MNRKLKLNAEELTKIQEKIVGALDTEANAQ